MTRKGATCEDCYFRREALCALPGNEPCPTFRRATARELAPPTQARLVHRTVDGRLQPAAGRL